MEIKNICTRKTVTSKNGEEKTFWNVVGVLKTVDTENGKKQFISLNMFPDTDFYVFEQRDRDDAPKQAPAQEINSQDIPF